MSYASQALLLVAALYRKGAITSSDKSRLKDLILVNDPLVKSVVEAFFVDSDLVEVVDSFARVLESMCARSPPPQYYYIFVWLYFMLIDV